MKAARRAGTRALIAVVPLLCVPAVHGDVTLEQTLRVEGIVSLLNMSGNTVTTISGDRARTESDVKMESRMMRMFGGGPTAEIVRLNDEKVYQLNLKKKTFTETTFEEQRAAIQQSMEQMREAQEQQQQQGSSGVDESSCQWSEPTATTDHTGETDTIAGYQAERMIVTATQSCSDPKTGQVCNFNLILDQWLAPEFEAGDEVADYYQSYARKLGFDVAESASVAQRMQAMFGRYQGIWSEIATQMEQTEGYPLRTSVALAVGGPQCDTEEQAQAAEAKRPGMGEAVGGAIGGALGGLLGRKRDAGRAAAEPAPQADQTMLPNGTVKLMSVSTELVSVTDEEADPALFEVPANFRAARK